MDSNKNDCRHFNEIIDERSGDIICTSCGLVLDVVYTQAPQLTNSLTFKNGDIIDYLSEMLSRLNTPMSYLPFIIEMYSKRNKTFSAKDKYLLASCCCYEALNELGIMTSIKMIAAVTGYAVEEISKMSDNKSVINFELDALLEKHCKMLNLSFHDFSLIKKTIPSEQSSGHNPLTIITAAIYNYCENQNPKIPLKTICTVTGISKISVHRYNRRTKCNFIKDPTSKEAVE